MDQWMGRWWSMKMVREEAGNGAEVNEDVSIRLNSQEVE